MNLLADISALPQADQLRLAAWILRGQARRVGQKPRQAPSVRPDRLRQAAQLRASESAAIRGTLRALRSEEIVEAIRGTELWRYA